MNSHTIPIHVVFYRSLRLAQRCLASTLVGPYLGVNEQSNRTQDAHGRLVLQVYLN